MHTIALSVVFVGLFVAAPAYGQTQNLNLQWDPVAADDIDHYNVYVGTAPGAHNVLSRQVPASSTGFSFDATPGTLYYFAVSAVDAAGIEGQLSQEIDGSVPDFLPLADRSSTAGTWISPLKLAVYDPDGDVLSYAHTGLPLGLSLDSSTGNISGIPTSIGSFDVTIQVSDGTFIRSRSFVWTILGGESGGNAAPTLTITSLSSTLASPQGTYTSIGFRATAAGGTAPYQFKWWVYDGTAWFVARDWNSSASLTWQPSTPGNYIVAAWARNAGVTADASQALAQVNYTIGTTATSSASSASETFAVTMTTSLPSPQAPNTSIRFTAAASGGSGSYEYKW